MFNPELACMVFYVSFGKVPISSTNTQRRDTSHVFKDCNLSLYSKKSNKNNVFQICYDAVETLMKPIIIDSGIIPDQIKKQYAPKLGFIKTENGFPNRRCVYFFLKFVTWYINDLKTECPVILHIPSILSEQFTLVHWLQASDEHIITAPIPRRVNQTFKGMGLGMYQKLKYNFEHLVDQR